MCTHPKFLHILLANYFLTSFLLVAVAFFNFKNAVTSAVVIIDDEPISNFITKKLLEISGHNDEIVDYTNPTEAFKVLTKKHDMVLFLDLNMPQMSGWDFLEKMKNENICHKTIILTASNNIEDEQRAKKYSFVSGFLTKPLNKENFGTFFSKEMLQ